jgi:hypothetical protein
MVEYLRKANPRRDDFDLCVGLFDLCRFSCANHCVVKCVLAVAALIRMAIEPAVTVCAMCSSTLHR